jgi:hypothetical protein
MTMWKSAREKIDLFRQTLFPVSYPQSGIICGTNSCRNQALVWLTFDEEKQYHGASVFSPCLRHPPKCRFSKVQAVGLDRGAGLSRTQPDDFIARSSGRRYRGP